MEIRKAQILIVELMDQHGLIELGWRAETNRSKTTLGQCVPQSRVLYFSRFVIPHATAEQMRHIALHEIAHALEPADAHGEIWAAKAAEIGYNDSKLDDLSYLSFNAKKMLESAKSLDGTPAGKIGVGDIIRSAKTGLTATIVADYDGELFAIDDEFRSYGVTQKMALASKVERVFV